MITAPTSLLLDFKSRTDASDAAASLAATALDEAILSRNKASLAVSGGSTPGSMLRRLSNTRIDWSCVTIGLVDERFVPPNHTDSNERLIRNTLLKKNASAATFLPMFSDTASPLEAAEAASLLYAPHTPFDFVLLGMGLDGHTASWFPDSGNLPSAYHPSAPTVTRIDASGCPVAGGITERLTLAFPALCTAHHVVLLIFGEEKRSVFQNAMNDPSGDLPIRRAVKGLGPKLTTFWAP